MDATVRPLPAAVQSLLQASSHINSFRGAVEELVYNSLDSKATSIAVRINYTNFSIQVIDDGDGIKKPDMDLIGSKYMTSKITDNDGIKSTTGQYGFRGSALANLIDVSGYVSVTSRYRNTNLTLGKVFRRGKVGKISETVPRPSQGTTVELKDFLYNLKLQKDNLNPIKELQEIKCFLEHTAIFHHGVSFSLRDDVKHNVILKIPKCKDIYQRVESIYGVDVSKNLQELQVEKSPYRVRAYLGMKCTEDDIFQMIYLNGRHLINSKMHVIVNSHLSKIFTLTSKKINKHSRLAKESQPKRKAIPFYMLFVYCPYNAYDVTQMTNKTMIEFHNWGPVSGLLNTLINVFAESLKLKSGVDDKNTLAPANMTGIAIATKPSNIQEKVTSIIEKVLKSDSRKILVQNGVKGKAAKRRSKIQGSVIGKIKENSEKKEKHSAMNRQVLDSAQNVSKPEIKDKEVSAILCAIKKDDFPRKKNAMTRQHHHLEKSSLKTLKILKTSKNLKQKINPKEKFKNDSFPNQQITKRFQAVEGSVKERCRNIAYNARNLLEKYNKLKQKRKICISEATHTSNVYKSGKIESIQKRSGKIVIREFIPFPKNCNRKFFEKCFREFVKCHLPINTDIKSRYDLVHTIIKSQDTNNYCKVHNAIKQNNISKNYTEANKKKNLETELAKGTQILTYQSHHYDQNNDDSGPYPRVKRISHEISESRTIDLINVSKRKRTSHFSMKPSLKPKIMIENNKIDVPTVCAQMYDTDNETFDDNAIFKKPITQEKEYNNNDFSCQRRNKSLLVKEFADISKKNSMNNKNNERYEEVNKSNSFTLSSQEELRRKKQNTYLQPAISQSINTKVLETEEIRDVQPIINLTYNIKKPVQIKSIDIANESDHFTNYISETTYNASVYHTIYSNRSKESKQENDPEYTINESIENYKTDFTNDCSNFGYCFENRFDTENNIELTFTSRSCPLVMTGNINNKDDEIIEMHPINICEAVLESSDMFETGSQKIENVNSYKGIIKMTENRNNHVNKSYCKAHDISYNSKHNNKVSNEHDTEGILPNGQVCQDSNFNEMFDDSLCEAFLQDTAMNTVTNNYSVMCENSKQVENQNTITDKNKEIIGTFSKLIGIEEEDFEKVVNPNCVQTTDIHGKLTYLDVKTGMTYTSNINNSSNFNVKRRPSYMPKGFSPMLQNKVQLKTSELPSQEYFTKSLYDNFVKDVEKCSEVYEANVRDLAHSTDTDKAQSRFRKMNASIVFDASSIATAKVLGQVDCKFIACVMQGKLGKYLTLFDQHAVDERIRLEALLKDYKTESTWKSVPCDEFSLAVTEDELFYLENFADKFQKLGLDWTRDPLCKNEISVTAVSLAIIGKKSRKTVMGDSVHVNLRRRRQYHRAEQDAMPALRRTMLWGIEVVVASTKAVIREHVKMLKSTNGAFNTPQCLMDLVNMEACRSAVKFGQALGRAAQARLPARLARCAAPFQCAHGRPDMALLLAVKPERRSYKINMEKLKKFKSEH